MSESNKDIKEITIDIPFTNMLKKSRSLPNLLLIPLNDVDIEAN